MVLGVLKGQGQAQKGAVFRLGARHRHGIENMVTVPQGVRVKYFAVRLPTAGSGAWVGIRSASGLELPGPPVHRSPNTLSSSHPALPGLSPLRGPAQSQGSAPTRARP